ncbi:MAG TPA: MBL fold metallo-hydrolase [Candidatus Nanoarchaeia archaeon]|nr:MBL fold metallo-hydrolase [Candidatus Nanoarchaeia archaeon]
MKWSIIILILVVIFLILILFNEEDITSYTTINPKISKDYLEATILDVGQGDAILLEEKENSILIDCGPDKEKIEYELTKNLNEPKIELLILTHAHADHVTGCLSVLKTHQVDQIWYNGETYDSETYNEFLTLSKNKRQQVSTNYQDFISNIELNILNPTKLTKSPNDNSIVLKATLGESSILLTGDCEIDCESNLQGDLTSEVLKIGHHGSSTSSTQLFLDRVNAKYYAISVGKDNKYSHPNQETLTKLKSPYRTDINGDILFKLFSNGDIIVKTEKT